jgi:hypothetical protein
MIELLQRKRGPSSILGLALDGARLDAVVVHRSNGSLRVQKTFTASLALNPLAGDPELVGREIRNHLDQAGIRERRCAVCLPLSWALTLQTKMPDLPAADEASFLEIEAERGFPYSPETLRVCQSRYRAADGGQYATLVAIPRNHLSQLQKAFKAAQLRPATFTLGIVALLSPDTDSSQGVLALAIGEHSVDLQVTCGGGVAALRSLEGAIESEGAQKHLYPDLLAREIRITLGQLPVEFRNAVRKATLSGRSEWVQRFAGDIAPRLQAMGIRLESVKNYSADQLAGQLPPDAAVSPALSLAARHLTGTAPAFEFLPPKTTSWQQFTTRVSSKRLAWAGATAGTVLFLGAALFLIQQWQLSRLESKWTALAPAVTELEGMRQQIKKYRPWFDESFRAMTILRNLTEAFPEDGAVSAKSVEIRDLSTVTCSGTARDTQALLKVLDQLRQRKEIGDVKVEQIRGKAPLQFTFNFRCPAGGANENQ